MLQRASELGVEASKSRDTDPYDFGGITPFANGYLGLIDGSNVCSPSINGVDPDVLVAPFL